MSNLSSETSVFLLGRNSIGREGLRLLLEGGSFRVAVSQEEYSVSSDWPRDLAGPHLIVLDTGKGDQLDLQAMFKGYKASYPQARLVILAESFEFEGVMRAFAAGADGYIVKEIGCQSLMESLRLIALGEKVMPSALAQFLPETMERRTRPARPGPDLAGTLSEREIETFRRMCRGEPNKVIAQNLGITEATVKVHVKAILRKLHLKNRTQAVAWALGEGADFGGPDCRRSAAGHSSTTPGAIAA